VPVLGKWIHWFHFCETHFKERINRGKKRLCLSLLKIFSTLKYVSHSAAVPFTNFSFSLLNLCLHLGDQNSPRKSNRSCGFWFASNEFYYMILIGELCLNLGCRSGFEKIDYQSRVRFMYSNLTDISDIASLPASLFNTPVKLFGPFC
jgi:hypothetical protein